MEQESPSAGKQEQLPFFFVPNDHPQPKSPNLPGVNFITFYGHIFRTNVISSAFFNVHVTTKTCQKGLSYEKRAYLTLMKLTEGSGQAQCDRCGWNFDNESFLQVQQTPPLSVITFGQTKKDNIN